MRNRSGRKQNRRQRGRQRQNLWVGAGIALILLLLVIYFTWQETAPGQALDPATVPDPAIGLATAPVEIMEFGDFGCSACRGWHLAGIRDAVLDRYGDQVRFVWKDFPVITPQSPQAAEAAHCAAVQGKFWDFHDTVYERFAGLNANALRSYATQIELDLAAFDSCLERGDMRRIVQANLQIARQLGLRGTPGFAINGRALPAPPSLDQLVQLIDQELAGQRTN